MLRLVTILLLLLGGRSALAGPAPQAAQTTRPQSNLTPEQSAALALEIAKRPAVFDGLSKTRDTLADNHKAFRLRQYLDGYKLRGERNPSGDADALKLIETWIAVKNGDEEPDDQGLRQLSAKLVANSACTDPLVLTVAAVNSSLVREATNLLVRALQGFETSKHKAYPKLFATLTLARLLPRDEPEWLASLDTSALGLLKECFTDGSFVAGDQADIADILLAGWCRQFKARHEAAVWEVVRNSSSTFNWLGLLMEGDFEVAEAWKVRGNGTSVTVTEAGWKGFSQHLGKARDSLTAAWKLRPDLPQAPTLMISVALGEGGITEMRLWFDRATTARLDYIPAWKAMRSGFRPRWYGSLEAVLAFGVTALNTGRFDTLVPREFFEALNDIEQDAREASALAASQHLYDRQEIWPHLQKMYEGYLAEPAAPGSHDGWRDGYLRVAYYAGKFDVARKQLEAANWQLSHGSNWLHDASLVPNEIAARTGPQRKAIEVAEGRRVAGETAKSLELYRELAKTGSTDKRTQEFIRDRVFTLDREQRLEAGGWVDMMPTDDQMSGWHTLLGNWKRLPDGTLEVQSGPGGHSLYCRVRQGVNCEVRGTFEIVKTATKEYQAGLVIGHPAAESSLWYGIRFLAGPRGRSSATFSRGWSGKPIVARASINGAGGGTNSFLIHLDNSQLNATVNGEVTLKGAQLPGSRTVPTEEVLLGLGGYNGSNETVIRYSHLEARKLPNRR